MTSAPFFFGNATVISAATAVSIASLISGAGFTITGQCVGLTVTFDKDTYWGNSASVTDINGGALVSAGQSVSDSASGWQSNVIPISQMFVYRAAALNTSAVIYARFIP